MKIFKPVIFFFAFIVIVLFLFVFSVGTNDSNFSYGINGSVEIRCVDGVKVLVSSIGHVQQMIGPNGGAVQCQ